VAGRADILVVPDLEAGNMLAKSLSSWPARTRRHRARRARADRPDQPRRLGATRSPRARWRRWSPTRGARRWQPAVSGAAMADAIVVLNAGSSSLKFSVFAVGGGAGSTLRCAARSRAVHRAALRRQGRGRRRGGDEKRWGEGVDALGHDGALDTCSTSCASAQRAR
jgi:hypothetical protein